MLPNTCVVSDDSVICPQFAASSENALLTAACPVSVLPSGRMTIASGRYIAVRAVVSFLL